MNTRTKKLRDLMAAHNLTADDVAKILNRAPQTVRVWRCRTERTRVIPDHTLALLEKHLPNQSV